MISKAQIKAVKQLEMKKFRMRNGLFVAEGPKVVGDLLRCGYKPTTLFATQEWEQNNDERQELVSVTHEELCKISFLQHPQQVLAVFPIPDEKTNVQQETTAEPSLSLVLDGVQDPGNLGTIIRIADWFGISTIYCSEDTADAWNPKVVQATMGSIARVHIIYCDLLQLLKDTTLPVYGTLLDGENIYEQTLSKQGFIVMGNEGNGISQPIREVVSHRLLIPSFRQGAESLNVAIATAITCSEFQRR